MTEDRDPIYLDHNATTPVHPEVLEAMLPYLREQFGNPSSSHAYGQRAHAAVERAREQIAALLGCAADEIVFTSGGTEANNLAIRGTLAAAETRRHIVTSTVEHPATARPCAHLEARGYEVTRVPVNADGQVCPEEVRPFVRGDTALVTVMLAQNETGTVMPVRRIADLAHAQGAAMHTDAAQAVGKIPTDVAELGVDLLSLAGHKLYAPKGVGALYVRRGTRLQPLLLGAGHERGLRPGTENVAGLVGLGQACALAQQDLDVESGRQRVLLVELWQALRTAVPGLQLNGHSEQRLPNTLNLSFPGVRGSAVLAAVPEVAASTGSACHEGGEAPSAVLIAMGLDPITALGAVRLSLGRSTTREQIATAVTSLVRGYRDAARATGQAQ
ncbi:MAG: aminotransferase class V-fold PLP-dependent enzyme [Candidatus Latescibacterota bacterium]|jgi:cysteine desulfurase